MSKKIFVTWILILLIIGLFSSLTMAQNLDSRKIGIKAHVAAHQELEVVEPVMVSFNYPWQGLESGQPLILKDVGKILVKSNSNWILNINNAMYSDFEIYVKSTGSMSNWQNLNNIAYLSNTYGKYNLSWDIKIIPPNDVNGISQGNKQIQLSFIISKI